MHRLIFVVLLLACPILGAQTPSRDASERPNPFVVGVLGSVVPGAGYFHLKQYDKAAYSFSLMLPMIAKAHVTTPDRPSKSTKAVVGSLATNMYMYTVYDSFQEALTEEDRQDLIVNHPHYSFGKMFFAPLDIENYASVRMIGPNVLLGLSAAKLIGDLSRKGLHRNMDAGRLAAAIPLTFLYMFFVGMGEEAEFRGFQYPAFAQATGSQVMGNVMQAATFGSCHTKWATRNGLCSQPYVTGHLIGLSETIDESREFYAESSSTDGGDLTDMEYFTATFLTGLYLGWVANEDRGLLRTIAYHSMSNTLLTLRSLLVEGNTGRIYLNVSFDLP